MEKLELHYYLENDYHSMDAFIKNKAEAQLLKLIKEVSETLDLDLTFEIEALKQGGIKEFIKVLKKKKNKKKALRILAFIGVIFSGVITNIISDKITKDPELEKLQKEELQLHIKKLKQDLEKNETSDKDAHIIIENLTLIISKTDKVKLYRSNFYSALVEEPKIEKISTTELGTNNEPLSKEKIVNRSEFNNFIIEKIKIEAEYINDANIEIVSPVLKSSEMKWRGYLNSRLISFNLLDTEFKNSVLNREISFSSGTSIKCSVELEKEMDEEGNIKITEINAFDVVSVFEGTSAVITRKGKQIHEEKKQFKIDFDKKD